MKNIRIPLRLRELRFALRQIEALDWIDQRRLVLVGFSEGAQTAAAYSGDAFAAIVLMGTNCKFSGGSPQAHSATAVLSLMGADDHYYQGIGCRIKRAAAGSASIVIDDAGHNLRYNQSAITALRTLLRQVLAGP